MCQRGTTEAFQLCNSNCISAYCQFNQKFLFLPAGPLTKKNGIPWRGDSCLHDGSTLSDVKGGLVGGYYDAGDNIKFHFPMAFSMTLLSWSVIEYGHKYKAIGEYDHVTDIIKWGTDYLLRTFNSSATTITKMYSQVIEGKKNGTSLILLLQPSDLFKMKFIMEHLVIF